MQTTEFNDANELIWIAFYFGMKRNEKVSRTQINRLITFYALFLVDSIEHVRKLLFIAQLYIYIILLLYSEIVFECRKRFSVPEYVQKMNHLEEIEHIVIHMS